MNEALLVDASVEAECTNDQVNQMVQEIQLEFQDLMMHPDMNDEEREVIPARVHKELANALAVVRQWSARLG